MSQDNYTQEVDDALADIDDICNESQQTAEIPPTENTDHESAASAAQDFDSMSIDEIEVELREKYSVRDFQYVYNTLKKDPDGGVEILLNISDSSKADAMKPILYRLRALLTGDSSTVSEPSGGISTDLTIEESPDPVDSEIGSESDSVAVQSAEDKTSETTAIIEHSSNSTECRSLVLYQRITPIEFLNRIYQFVPNELRDELYSYIWSRDNENHNKRVNSFNLSEIDKMLEVAKNINNGYKNISFSMGLIDRPLGTHERAKSSDIVAISCLWIDIDVANDVHGQAQRLAPTIEIAREIITAQLGKDLKPSLVIDSGYGIHAYWIFDKLFEIKSDNDRKRAKSMLEMLQGIIRSNPQGYFIDPTADLSRMLRLPGTLNWKGGNKNDAPICKVIETSDKVFALNELESQLQTRLKEINPMISKNNSASKIDIAEKLQRFGDYSTSNVDFSSDIENLKIKMLVGNCAAVRYIISNIESMKYPVVAPILRTLLKIDGSEQFVFDLVKRWRGDKFDISTTEKQLEGLKKLPPAQCLDLLAMGIPCNGGEKHECIVARLNRKTPDAIRTSPIVRRAISQDLGGTIGERFVNAPDQIRYLEIPDGFKMYENGIDLVTEKSSKSVSLTPFVIQSFVKNESSELIASYNIAFRKKDGRWSHVLIDAKDINESKKLVGQLQAALVHVPEMQGRLANKYIVSFVAKNEENITTITQYSKLGWRDNFEFIHPEFQFDENGNELYKLIQSDAVSHIHCKGNIESEIDLMRRACVYQNARAIYNMQFLAPLVEPLGIRNPILYINAESATGKSSALRGANSIFGDSEFMFEANGTPKSLIEKFKTRNSLPVNLNEISHIKGKNKKEMLEMLIRTFESGFGYSRLNKNITQQDVGKFRNSLIINGEKEMLDDEDPHGLKTRCFVLAVDGVIGSLDSNGKFIVDEETCKLLNDNHLHNLNHGNIGVDYIRRLQSEFKIHGVQRLIDLHAQYVTLIENARRGIQRSHSDFLAGLMLADQLRLQFYENMNESDSFISAMEWIKQMLQHVQTREQNRDINGALHAIEDAFNRDELYFGSGVEVIHTKEGEDYRDRLFKRCGYKVREKDPVTEKYVEKIYANPSWVRDVLKAAGYNPKSEIIALGKRGDLEINLKGNEPSIVKKIEGQSRRVIGLTFISKRETETDSIPNSNSEDEEDIPPEQYPFLI